MPPAILTDAAMSLSTPLDADRPLTLIGFTGRESMSQLFHFHLDVLDTNRGDLPFDKLLGKSIIITLGERTFNGIVARISQGIRTRAPSGGRVQTRYRMEMVPSVWVLTKQFRCRVFQQKTVKEILTKLFEDFAVKFDRLKRNYLPREYCVQYRESDFDFASRIMEDEGIYYFFRHTDVGDEMVLADTPVDVSPKTPQSYPPMPEPKALPFGLSRSGKDNQEERVSSWEKVQELRSGGCILREHHFELPFPPPLGKLIAEDTNAKHTVQVGTVTHRLEIDDNAQFKIDDFPGGFAHFFDNVDKGGGPMPGSLNNLNQLGDAQETAVKLRLQQETVSGLVILASSNFRHLVCGHQFELTQADEIGANGQYLLTTMGHSANLSGDPSSNGSGAKLLYSNSFTCIPVDPNLPFRPQRLTAKPVVHGPQTAFVVGSGAADEEIHVDKFGRVKVEFHWDHAGKQNTRDDQGTFKDSSCWVRVGTPWAGQQWGMVHIPRIGQEVIVNFLDGDPDRPIIVGSVYNAVNMPPYDLPKHKTQSGIKSRSTLKGMPNNFNEFRFEDKKGQEEVLLHAERNLTTVVEADEARSVGHDRSTEIGNDDTLHVKHDLTTLVDNDESRVIGNDRDTLIGDNDVLTIKNDQFTQVENNRSAKITSNDNEQVGVDQTIEIGNDQVITVKNNAQLSVKGAFRIVDATNLHWLIADQADTSAKTSISLVVDNGASQIRMSNAHIHLAVGGDSFIKIVADGILLSCQGSTIKLDSAGVHIGGAKIDGTAKGNVQFNGALIELNC